MMDPRDEHYPNLLDSSTFRQFFKSYLLTIPFSTLTVKDHKL